MPPTVGSGQIVITANTGPAVAALQQVQAAGQSAAASIATNFTNAAKALNSSPLISTAETISALFIQMGGPVARVASVVTSMIRPVAVLGTAFGQLLAPVAALALPTGGLAAVAFSLKALAGASVEAAKELDKIGIAVDPGQRARIDAYADANEQLSRAMDELMVSVGAEIAPALAAIVHQAAAGVDAFTEWRDSIGKARTELEGFDKALSGMTLGASDAFREWITGSDELAISTGGLTIMEKAATIAHEEATQALADETEGERQNKIAKDAAREATRLLKEEEERAKVVMDARIVVWRAAADAADAAADREIQAILAVRIAQSKAYDAQTEEIDAIMAKRQQDAAAWEADSTARALREAQVYLSLSNTAIGAIESITSTALIGFEQRIAAGEELGRRDAKNANAALAAYEVVAISQAGVSAALAGINSFASLTAIELNPFTAAATATALSLASFAAATYAIHAHKPFSYQPVDSGGGYGRDRDYDPDDPHDDHGTSDNPRADKPDIPTRPGGTSRGRGRRDPVVRVEIVRDARGSGKLRR